MRIIIAACVLNQPEGGVPNVVHNTAEALRGRGHDVTCLFTEEVLPASQVNRRFSSIYFAFQLARILQERKSEFDVAEIHAPNGFAYGLARKFLTSAGLPPYVMMLHGIEERRIHAMTREARKGRAWYFRWKNRVWQQIYHMLLYRLAIMTADYSVVINRETWTMLQLKYNRDIDKVWYVPNAVECHYFSEREYVAGDALRLLFVGSWLDHKGIYYLRDSFEALAKRIPELRLTIAGCSASAEAVKKFFSSAIRSQLDVLPFVARKDMPALYTRHDIFVFPSLFEGLPIVLLEAMATGMPVVTTETCGMMDIVENNYNGVLVKPADTDAFVAATERLIHSAELRARLGRAARESIKRHTWGHVAEQLEGVFERATKHEWR